jgi:hypothetical protein
MSDIDAGEAAGPGLRILVASHLGKRAEGTPDHEEVADLGETLQMLRSHFTSTTTDQCSGRA